MRVSFDFPLPVRIQQAFSRHVIHFEANAVGIFEKHGIVSGRPRAVLRGCTISMHSGYRKKPAAWEGTTGYDTAHDGRHFRRRLHVPRGSISHDVEASHRALLSLPLVPA